MPEQPMSFLEECCARGGGIVTYAAQARRSSIPPSRPYHRKAPLPKSLGGGGEARRTFTGNRVRGVNFRLHPKGACSGVKARRWRKGESLRGGERRAYCRTKKPRLSGPQTQYHGRGSATLGGRKKNLGKKPEGAGHECRRQYFLPRGNTPMDVLFGGKTNEET